MAAKTLGLKGPDLAFSRSKPLKYQAQLGGTWAAAEKAQLEWTVGAGQAAPTVLPQKGETQEIAPKAFSGAHHLEVSVRFAPQQLSGKLDLSIIVMPIEPYPALDKPITSSDVKATPLKGSNRKLYVATVAGKPFSIGVEQPYPKEVPVRHGLFLTGVPPGPRFSGAAFGARFGHWNELLDATTSVEGKQSFVATNTYDRAFFTFGILQFTPRFANENLVELLRTWLRRVDAATYFPELTLKEVDGVDRIHDMAGAPLEDATHSAKLCAFLKPDQNVIGDTECLYAARFIHLARHDPQACLDQVSLAVGNFKRHLKVFHGAGIDARPDYICALICDIRNQGRAGIADVKKLLRKNGEGIPNDELFEALLGIGATSYAGRIKGLRKRLGELIAARRMGIKAYDEATGDFVQ